MQTCAYHFTSCTFVLSPFNESPWQQNKHFSNWVRRPEIVGVHILRMDLQELQQHNGVLGLLVVGWEDPVWGCDSDDLEYCCWHLRMLLQWQWLWRNKSTTSHPVFDGNTFLRCGKWRRHWVCIVFRYCVQTLQCVWRWFPWWKFSLV